MTVLDTAPRRPSVSVVPSDVPGYNLCLNCGEPYPHQAKRLVCSELCRIARRADALVAWRSANAAYIKQQAKLYYEEDPERQMRANKVWREKNPEHARALDRIAGQRHYALNPEKHREESRLRNSWVSPETRVEYRRRLRVRLRQAGEVYHQLRRDNPALPDLFPGVKDKARAMLQHLKALGIEVSHTEESAHV